MVAKKIINEACGKLLVGVDTVSKWLPTENGTAKLISRKILLRISLLHCYKIVAW